MSKPTLGKPLQFWKGNPFSQEFRFKDGDGVGRDLTGLALRAFITFDVPPLSIELAPASGWTLADQTQALTKGRAKLAVSKADILAWPTGKSGRYEIEIDDQTLIYGDVIVSQWVANNG